MAAILHVSDVFVKKDFNGNAQAKFQPSKNNEKYGTVRFRISVKRYDYSTKENTYDNYAVQWNNVAADSKMIEFLNTDGTKVSMYGELSQEKFKSNDGKDCTSMRITCVGNNAVSIAQFGNAEAKTEESQATPAPAGDNVGF